MNDWLVGSVKLCVLVGTALIRTCPMRLMQSLMGPSLMFSAVMQISSAFAVGAISSALVGFPSVDYAAHTIVLHVSDFAHTRFEMGYAAALSVVLFVMMLGFKGIVNLLLKRYSDE